MSKLSPEEIARYAHDAGFKGHDLTVAVAVALAESAGQTKAHNDTPPDDSYGLWQINMYHYKQYLDEAEKATKALGKDPDRHHEQPQASAGEPGRLRVDPDALTGYAKAARTISDELAALRRKELSGVRGLAEDSFGKLGKETGFAVALERFGGALREQVKAVGANADKLAGSVAKTARHYGDQDHDIARDLLGLLRDN